MPSDLSTPLRVFDRRITSTLGIVASTEALWLTAPPTSQVRKQLKVDRLEALYESTYLRIFSFWEAFLEDCTIRLMSGSRTVNYTPIAAVGKTRSPSQTAALAALLGEGRAVANPRDYLLWHNPAIVADRVARWIQASPVETVCRSNQQGLEHAAAVRHHIAHGSTDSARKFKIAALHYASSDFNGLPGRFLRADDNADPLNRPRWILRLTDQLASHAKDIAS